MFDFLDEIDKDVKCHNQNCSWSGKRADANKEYVHSDPESWMALAGREGYEYHCPKCGWIVDTFYWKMS